MADLNQFEAYGLFFLLTSRSKFVSDLNDQVQDPNTSLDDVFNHFQSTLTAAPFNIDADKLDRDKFEPLWANAGVKRAEVDRSADSVGAALEPAIPYDDPPCPPVGVQDTLWSRITHA